MNTMIKLAVVGFALVGASGCATATRGTSVAWEASSTPSGARVETTNGYFCQATPCAIRMPRRSQFVATFTLDGYQPATVTVTNGISGGGGTALAGNVLVGGPIGGVVDLASGATLDLYPNPAHVDLKPIGEP